MDNNYVLNRSDARLHRLPAALESSWDRETSSDPDAWDDSNQAWGQCAVTALVVQWYLGGQLCRAEVGAGSHYWNWLKSGPVDLTRRQFTAYEPGPEETAARDYVLSFPETRRRYELLLSRVETALSDTSWVLL